MTVKILINTKFLLFDESVKESIHLDLISISENKKYRNEQFYDEVAIRELGTHAIGSLFQKYAFGVIITDLEYIKEDSSNHEKLADIGNFVSNIDGYFNSILFHLWFAKDNCITADFIYAKSSPELDVLSHNYITMSTASCEVVETKFSESEIKYAYEIFGVILS